MSTNTIMSDLTRRDFLKGSAGLTFAVAVNGTGAVIVLTRKCSTCRE